MIDPNDGIGPDLKPAARRRVLGVLQAGSTARVADSAAGRWNHRTITVVRNNAEPWVLVRSGWFKWGLLHSTTVVAL